MYFKVYTDVAGEYRWSFYAANHEKLADSGEGYKRKEDCLQGIEFVKGSGTAPVIQD